MRRRATSASWAGFGWGGFRLALEAQQVIALRLAKLAAGGAAGRREARRMVSEKIATAAEAQMLLFGAASRGKSRQGAKSVLGLYRRRVGANKRRLSKR